MIRFFYIIWLLYVVYNSTKRFKRIFSKYYRGGPTCLQCQREILYWPCQSK
eukprot:UN28506